MLHFHMEIEAWYTCSYCFEQNEVLVDVSGGTYQEYIEDCQVCCRPNRLRITVRPDFREADVQSEEA
jgi:Cysteine-rich CPXCG